VPISPISRELKRTIIQQDTSIHNVVAFVIITVVNSGLPTDLQLLHRTTDVCDN